MSTEGARMQADALLTLTRWFSPAFPTGAFAWSHGLEAEVAQGRVHDGDSVARWLAAILAHGSGRNDAILLAAAWRAPDAAALGEIADLARALAPGAERHAETLAQGTAFVATLAAAGEPVDALAGHADWPLPVAMGAAARGAGLPLAETLLVYLQTWAGNLVTIAVRHVPLGQSAGQAILSGLAARIADLAREAEAASLDDIGGCALAGDLASLEHETQPTRIFRS